MAGRRGDRLRAQADFHPRTGRPDRHGQHRLVGQFAGLHVLGQHAIADLDLFDRLPAGQRPDLRAGGETGAGGPRRHTSRQMLAIVNRLGRLIVVGLARFAAAADVIHLVVVLPPPLPPFHGLVSQVEAGDVGGGRRRCGLLRCRMALLARFDGVAGNHWRAGFTSYAPLLAGHLPAAIDCRRARPE